MLHLVLGQEHPDQLLAVCLRADGERLVLNVGSQTLGKDLDGHLGAGVVQAETGEAGRPGGDGEGLRTRVGAPPAVVVNVVHIGRLAAAKAAVESSRAGAVERATILATVAAGQAPSRPSALVGRRGLTMLQHCKQKKCFLHKFRLI